MDSKEVADKTALKELVDSVSILGDQKNVEAQVQLFTEDAVSETFAGDTVLLKVTGREAMKAAFSNFSKSFDTIYHLNGQLKAIINEDTATGILYCTATLIGVENGQRMITTIGIIYHDDFIRVNDRWLVAKRVGHFKWQDKREANS